MSNTAKFSIGLVLDMLTYARPMGSAAESVFCEKFLAPLPGAYRDTFGNWHVTIGKAPILWSAHTDTVHHTGGRQTIDYNADTGLVKLSKRSKVLASCLGADDTAGCAMLVCMIRAGIEGRYVFHYGEEKGSHGSTSLAQNHEEWLGECSAAIAFDRKGYTDVITHQFGRCCSDTFAASLAALLGMNYAPSDQGVFTDTSNYTEAIGECTNLSVGYFKAHSDRENLDLAHLSKLFDAVCCADFSKLVYERKPGEIDPDDYARWSNYAGFDWTHYYAHGGSSFDTTTRKTITHGHIVDMSTWRSGGNMKAIEACIACDCPFNPMQSTATDWRNFCTQGCENAWNASYLDRSYARAQAEIQRALRDAKEKK